MSHTPSPAPRVTTPNTATRGRWLIAASIALVAVVLAPSPAGLPMSGQRLLAVLLFAIIIWVTEAVAYPLSAVLILALGALLLGFSRGADGKVVGTSKALGSMLEGFSSTAVAVVAGALCLAAAMKKTGLDRRLALAVLARTGTRPRGILTGAILIGVLLSFFVPSTTARVGAVVPIMGGMVAACGLARTSRLAALLMITSAHVASIWNVAIKTAAAQNLVAVGLMQKTTGITVSWGAWFLYAAPWAIVMTLFLAALMPRIVPPEEVGGAAAHDTVRRQLAELGAVSGAEQRLIGISILLLGFWATEGTMHPLDTATTTTVAVGVMLLPRVGVLAWDEAGRLIPWGTVLLFAVGVSLGGVLISTGAARWVAEATLGRFGVAEMSVLGMVATLSAFTIIVHLGFASATSLAATLIPIMLAFFGALRRADVHPFGMVLVQQFVVSFGFILPVSSPQNMVAYGTGAFTTRDFIKTGVWITIVGYALLLLLSATYWRWLGLL